MERVTAYQTRHWDIFFEDSQQRELWNWEEARRGYQAAAADPAFYEATAALGRTARLRLGGTLAES